MNIRPTRLWILFAVFMVIHLINLTKLPVFADEAIYIRWSQYFFREPEKFAFFPLYDGKSPLYFWLISIFVPLKFDPLWIARFFSVIMGVASGVVVSAIAFQINHKKSLFWISFFIWMMLPFSVFYSRMALIDMTLTFWLALSTYTFLTIPNNYKNSRFYALLPGLFWGLALITKTSAFYFAPVYLAILIHTYLSKKFKIDKQVAFKSVIGFLLGLGMLGIMVFSEFFPFLFNRSADFAYTISDIAKQPFHIMATNAFRMGKWLLVYCSPLLLTILTVANKKNFNVRNLFLGLLFWLLPFLITGKVLSSRYILPSLIFIVPLMAVSYSKLPSKFKIAIGALFFGYCLYWNYFLIFRPNSTPYPIEDRVQFLTDWSSGHGIKESADYLIKIAKTESVLVATEGFFGTLPDGLMIYLDGKPELDNMRVEGVGLPIFGVPKLLSETPGFDRKFVIVNEHRFVGDPLPPGLVLMQKYPRPHGGPALLLLEYED